MTHCVIQQKTGVVEYWYRKPKSEEYKQFQGFTDWLTTANVYRRILWQLVFVKFRYTKINLICRPSIPRQFGCSKLLLAGHLVGLIDETAYNIQTSWQAQADNRGYQCAGITNANSSSCTLATNTC